jgi:hypothetical protein
MESMLVIATLGSLTLGTVMSVIAWRLLRHDSERRAARVEALRTLAGVAEIHPEEPDYQYAAAPLEAAATMFGAPERIPARRWTTRLAVGMAIVACAAVPYALYSLGVFGAIASASPAGTALPIELLSLRHTADDLGAFTVTGLVQNPSGGRRTSDIVAVVYLFDEAGRFVATGRAALDVGSLQPGDEATFVVTIPKAAGVGKYRVGFRLADGGVVAHVDRRGQPPVETTEDAMDPDRGRPVTSPALPPGRREGE